MLQQNKFSCPVGNVAYAQIFDPPASCLVIALNLLAINKDEPVTEPFRQPI